MLFVKFGILNVNVSSNLSEDTDILGRNFIIIVYKNHQVSL